MDNDLESLVTELKIYQHILDNVEIRKLNASKTKSFLRERMDKCMRKICSIKKHEPTSESLSGQTDRLATYIQKNHHSHIDDNGAIDVAINIMKHQQELIDKNKIKDEISKFHEKMYTHIKKEKYDLEDMIDTCTKMLNQISLRVEKLDEIN